MNTLELTREGAVLHVELNRPARRNAMSIEMMGELGDVFEGPGREAGAIVLSGRGAGFCSGADLREQPFDPEAVRAQLGIAGRVVRSMAACPAPIVAHVHGAAIGGGTCLALAADLVVADPDAVFGINQVERGLMPDMGIAWLLPERVGGALARRLLFTAERFSGRQAAEWNLCRLGTLGDAHALARDLAGRAEAVAETKAALAAPGLEAVLALEPDAEARMFQTETVRESIAAFTSR